ncbi:CMP-N-acetylneuraminate-beta-galactosamide-alpha-2,3-sialyltransferase 1-like [Pseudoliparis swirei]|uniref:CMP-N-acetylneuraminate-beta-galactosamide- alpha-2,3-sialyltransferase 1-like n=1 Tax=Pseudoliparis swirei TaxID=2059687 RepID=UPI0024BED14D|nr:CMP-N-acetylneuraminate-beta-galactosamide-alpha-2,3-sialyltransferase 1-like [Pseudoliparis swirei]
MTWSCLRSLRFRCLTSKVGVFILLLCVTGICVFWRGEIPSYFPPGEGRPCACDRCLREDETLFMQRFSKFEEPPFLSQYHNLSENHFNWWRRLQSDGRNFSVYKETVNKMFQMFPINAEVEASSPDRCRTCAVVGNSMNLKNSHYGPLIDFQDFVIRINKGLTKGYEEDVGTRTTHHVMYPVSAVDLENTTSLVLFAFKILDLEWMMKALNTGISFEERPLKANTDLVMVLNPAFMRYVHLVWLRRRGHYPSTGFMALILALHICDEVHVFGYGADSDGRWTHYWEHKRRRGFRTGWHPGHFEFAMIKELGRHQIIKFYRGW